MAVWIVDTYVWDNDNETWYYDSDETIDTREVYEIERSGTSDRFGPIYKVRIYRRGRYLSTYINEDDADRLSEYL